MSWTAVSLAVYAALIGFAAINVIYLRNRRRADVAHDGPLVSIVIPARNEAGNLRRLLPSLLGQVYTSFEIIVYDDGSDDETTLVAEGSGDERVLLIRGTGPPPGWIGKVHALFRATRQARGDVLLFLDADVEFLHRDALGQLMGRFLALPTPRVLTGLTRLSGGGRLLASMIPFALFVLFPVALAHVGRQSLLGVLNGQCWMIDRDTYLTYEPHRAHPREVLEDVQIGRYLKRHGAAPHLFDLQSEVAAWMYDSLPEAWRGFRKNTYLIAGGHPLTALTLAAAYLFTFVILPSMAPVSLVGLLILKGISDRFSGFPWWITLLTPVAVIASLLLLVDSAVAHWTGRVEWKGRKV